jgi:hypothetical protein
MGNFRITINAVGGHGVDRGKKNGEIVDFKAEDSTDGKYQSPDSIAKDFVERLKASGSMVDDATIAHWPGQDCEVQDNLLTGERKGNF